MPSVSLRHLLPFIVIATSVTIAACGSDSGSPTGGNGNSPTASEAQLAGSSIAKELEASATQLSSHGAARYGGESAVRTHDVGILASVRGADAPTSATELIQTWLYTGCGVVMPSPAADSDFDGVPDSATVTFALPACALSGVRAKSEGDVTGSMTIVDPAPMVAGPSFNLSITNLHFAFTNQSATFGETRNGTRVVTGDSITISQANDITTAFDSAGATVATIGNTMTLTFTAPADNVINMRSGLSNGTITANGGISFTAGSLSDTFTITTVTPLVYNPSCAATGTSPIQTGELRATVSTTSRVGHLEIVWAACGVATVTLVKG